MPTLTAFSEPTFGRVRLEINWQDNAAVTYARVVRNVDGAAVRLYGSTTEDATGVTYKNLSHGLAVLYDTEVPLDTATTYTLSTFSGVSTATATSGSVSVASSSTCWLKDPLRPAYDINVTFTGVQNPECVTTPGVYLLGLDEFTFESASAATALDDRPRPAWAALTRKDFTSELRLATRLLADRDRLRTLLAPGSVLLWQMPAVYGVPDIYVGVGSVVEARISSNHQVPWRGHRLPFAVVDRPEGLSYGVDAARWRDLCDVYPTWAAATAAGVTWLDVLQREAG